MTSINWPIIAGVVLGGGILAAVLIAVVLQVFFQHPKKRLNIANAYTDEHVKRLETEWADDYQKLKKSHTTVVKQCERRDIALAETQTKLNETRAALTILNNAAKRSAPLLRAVGGADEQVDKLEAALETVRKILER